jgi:hypothetical protein
MTDNEHTDDLRLVALLIRARAAANNDRLHRIRPVCINVDFGTDGRQAVDANEITGTMFAVHRKIGTVSSARSRCWVLTHVPTGLLINEASHNLRAVVVRRGRALTTVPIDWTQPACEYYRNLRGSHDMIDAICNDPIVMGATTKGRSTKSAQAALNSAT